MHKKTKIFIWSLLAMSVGYFFVGNISFAEAADAQRAPATASTTTSFDYKLLETFPGFFTQGQSAPKLPELILALYKFGIWTIGIAGLFMLTIGGIMYMGSAGNTSTAGNAKDIIKDALLGIAAAMGAYLLLYVINPDLTKLNLNLVAVNLQGGSAGPGGSGSGSGPTTPKPPGSTDTIGCKPNVPKCTACQNCTSVADICKENPCSLESGLASKLRTALSGQNARVTEGWPPTVNHDSSCHQNGTCADVNLTSNQGDPTAVKNLYDRLKNSGLNPVYESANCGPYNNVGVKCQYYSTMTAPSFHVNP